MDSTFAVLALCVAVTVLVYVRRCARESRRNEAVSYRAAARRDRAYATIAQLGNDFAHAATLTIAADEFDEKADRLERRYGRAVDISDEERTDS
jgi:tRNA C32,U32 (ribose-2'-O)-methylase TrmJ